MTKTKEGPPRPATKTSARIDGVVIGVLMGFDDDGAPLVVFPGNAEDEAIAARTTAALTSEDVGADVALMFEQGDPRRPLIMGRLLHPDVEIIEPAGQEPVTEDLDVRIDDQRVELTADKEIVLRCGKASITLTRAGKILLRGAYIFSRSTGVNKIKGGSVQLN
ncbi:MAG: DUF6484 domain-containing protein [Geminicoccaceae bacterium]